LFLLLLRVLVVLVVRASQTQLLVVAERERLFGA
jgi:hypothetical protein